MVLPVVLTLLPIILFLYSEHICKEQQNTVKYSALSTIFIAKNPFFFPPPVSIKHNALLDWGIHFPKCLETMNFIWFRKE